MPVACFYELIWRSDSGRIVLLKSIGFWPGLAQTVLKVRKLQWCVCSPVPWRYLIALVEGTLLNGQGCDHWPSPKDRGNFYGIGNWNGSSVPLWNKEGYKEENSSKYNELQRGKVLRPVIGGNSCLWDYPVGNGTSGGLFKKWKGKCDIRKKQNRCSKRTKLKICIEKFPSLTCYGHRKFAGFVILHRKSD